MRARFFPLNRLDLQTKQGHYIVEDRWASTDGSSAARPWLCRRQPSCRRHRRSATRAEPVPCILSARIRAGPLPLMHRQAPRPAPAASSTSLPADDACGRRPGSVGGAGSGGGEQRPGVAREIDAGQGSGADGTAEPPRFLRPPPRYSPPSPLTPLPGDAAASTTI